MHKHYIRIPAYSTQKDQVIDVYQLIFHILTATKTQDNLQVKQCNVSYMKIGCYLDPNIENSSFPSLILKPILPLLNESKTWSVRGEPWDTFLQDFVCSCAQRTKQLKYNYFGLKRFGK